jgi:viroplasmin and RNaseH domain-containing protein
MNLNQRTTVPRFSQSQKRDLLRDFSNTIDTSMYSKFDTNAARVAEILSDDEHKPKSNKESKSIIINFLENIDTETLSAVFLLAGTIITSVIKLYRGIRKLNENTPILKYEPIDNFNINSDDFQSLFESEIFQELDNQEQKEIETQIKDSNIKRVLDDEKFQFKFDSGYYMETINSNKLSDIPFSLKYHKNKTSNIDEFIDSVSNFLQSANVELTESDINKLRKHYQKYK